jgi:hypothetical protein
MQFAEEMTADFDERVSSLEDRYHEPTLNNADRLAIVRRQRRLLQRHIENLKRRAEVLRSRITMIRAEIAAMQSSNLEVRIVVLPPDAILEYHEILQPPLSIAWAIETEAELDMLFESATRFSDEVPLNIAPAGGSLWSSPPLPQPFEAQLQQIREQENRIWVANATPPTRYGDPYDKLVGCGGGLVLTSDTAHPQCNACGRHHVQPTEPVEIPQIRDDRRGFPSLNNRALIHARHARALARLDTNAMDEEITFRILQHPEQWGDFTQMVRDNQIQVTWWRSFARLEQRDD